MNMLYFRGRMQVGREERAPVKSPSVTQASEPQLHSMGTQRPGDKKTVDCGSHGGEPGLTFHLIPHFLRKPALTLTALHAASLPDQSLNWKEQEWDPEEAFPLAHFPSHFWRFGEWVDVSPQMTAAHSPATGSSLPPNPQWFWCALVEKAYLNGVMAWGGGRGHRVALFLGSEVFISLQPTHTQR